MRVCELLEAAELRLTAETTSTNLQVIVLRVLAPETEPGMQLLRHIWAAWRHEMCGLSGTMPSLWNLLEGFIWFGFICAFLPTSSKSHQKTNPSETMTFESPKKKPPIFQMSQLKP
jgi:hypothetical protein